MFRLISRQSSTYLVIAEHLILIIYDTLKNARYEHFLPAIFSGKTWFFWLIPRCYKDVYVDSLYPHNARLRNYFLAQCFVGNYDDLNDFKSEVNRQVVPLGPFSSAFLYDFVYQYGFPLFLWLPVIEIVEKEIFTLLFHGSVMVVHMLILLTGNPPHCRFLRFLALTHSRGEPNHCYNFWIPSYSQINRQRQSTINTKFWAGMF